MVHIPYPKYGSDDSTRPKRTVLDPPRLGVAIVAIGLIYIAALGICLTLRALALPIVLHKRK